MKFDHQAFQVSDIDSSIDFYVNKLGFKLLSNEVNNEEHEAFAFVVNGDARIELLQDLAGPYEKPVIKRPYCPHFCLKTDDMAQTVKMLKENNINIVRGPLEIKGEETWIY
ncbi:MAG TPA: VOC family protein, partial [Bacteroidales bacterium]|nr:VOC family protein [Bacteroidales bacterium]